MEYLKNDTNFQNFSKLKTERPSNGTVANVVLNSRNIFLISLYSLICLVGVLGNGYVCQMILRNKNKSQFMVLLLSLSLADLLCSMLSPIPLIHDVISKERWYLGAVLCPLTTAVNPMLLIASTWSLVVISIERYRAVKWPLSVTDKKRATYIILVVVWGSAALLSVPMALTWRLEGNACIEVTDYLSLKEQFAYLIVIALLIWVLPSFILGVIYTSIVKEIKRSKMQQANSRAVADRMKQNKHITRMFILLVSLFTLLTFPYVVFFCVGRYILAYRIHTLNVDGIKRLVLLNSIFFISCLINSCINPIIYAKLHRGKSRAFLICFNALRSIYRTKRSTARVYSLDANPANIQNNKMETRGDYRAKNDQ